MKATADSPFGEEFLTKLEQLFLLARRMFRGQVRAERRSRQVGASLEFADYRNYVLGDDLRSIDWNIYGRLDRLFVKLFEEEQDLHIYVLVDASASMHWLPGDGSQASGFSKFNQARRIAAALAYIGLANLDRVNLFYFSGGLDGDMGMARGKSQFHSALEFLRTRPESPTPTNLHAVARAFCQRTKRRGLVFLLSDFLDAEGYEPALAELRNHRFETHLVQVLAPEEINPALQGDLRLVEPESNQFLDVTVSPALLRRYKERLLQHQAALSQYCQRFGIGCALTTTAIPFEDLVLKLLRESRLVA